MRTPGPLPKARQSGGGILWPNPHPTEILPVFKESSTTFQEVLSSGKLEIIRDERVRTAIQGHYDFISDGKQLLQRLIEQNRDEFTRLMLDNYISMTNQYDLAQVEARLADRERGCVQIENFLFTTNAVQTIMLYGQNSIKSRTEVLIGAISDYLGGYQHL